MYCRELMVTQPHEVQQSKKVNQVTPMRELHIQAPSPQPEPQNRQVAMFLVNLESARQNQLHPEGVD